MRFSWLTLLLVPACTASTTEPEPRTTTQTGPTTATTEPASVTSTTAAEAPAFDRGAAARAIGAVRVNECRVSGGPSGNGHITLAFANDGSASIVDLDPPFADTDVGRCMTTKYAAVRVPAFGGAPVRVGKSFVIAP